MTAQENPGTVSVRLIWDDSVALLEKKGKGSLSVDSKIMLAALLFADDEGVAQMKPRQLARYCADWKNETASPTFLRRRIAALIEAGVLAPGSTPTELRSMIGRSAYGVTEEVAA